MTGIKPIMLEPKECALCGTTVWARKETPAPRCADAVSCAERREQALS